MNPSLDKILEPDSYTTPLNYVSGRIIEYDISAANISVLLDAGKITEQEFQSFLYLPKGMREKTIGKMIRDNHELSVIIEEGIRKARFQLAELNQIQPEEIVRSAKDAVYINRFTDLKILSFGGRVAFRPKGEYQCFLRLKSFLFFFNFIDNINVEVKGINDKLLPLHEDLLRIISNTVFILEKISPQDALRYITENIEDYINLKLDPKCYREFNYVSGYRIKKSGFVIFEYPGNELIDINCNLQILRELYKIVLDKYCLTVRR